MVSGQRALGNCSYDFEEVACWLSLIRGSDVNLEMRLGWSHGQTLDDESGVPGFGKQRIGALERRGAAVVHNEVVARRGLAGRPLFWHASERFAIGPAPDIERFELDPRSPAQHAANNEHIAAATGSAERPRPRRIARLEEDNEGHAGERRFALADHHLNSARPQPTHSGAFPERGQSVLHPSHKRSAPTDIPDRASGKPGNQRDRSNNDEFGHGGDDSSTPAGGGWMQAVREFIYGMTTYEFVQQAREMRASMERLFLVGVFGDMLGVPILPSYYGLRLLPWVVPEIERWKREILREREFGSSHEHHLHGL